MDQWLLQPIDLFLYCFRFVCLHFVLSAFAVDAVSISRWAADQLQRLPASVVHPTSFCWLYSFLCGAQSNVVDDDGIGIGGICMN